MTMTIDRHARGYRLVATCRLEAPLDEVFPFFSSAGNLERITPPHLRFQIVANGPLDMCEGLVIDYRIRLGLLPMRWRSEISAWEPPHRFVDEQRRGPYRRWVHEHRFEPDGEATICTDVVDYAVPGGALVHELFVRRDLERIFSYRAGVMAELFNHPRPQPQPATNSP